MPYIVDWLLENRELVQDTILPGLKDCTNDQFIAFKDDLFICVDSDITSVTSTTSITSATTISGTATDTDLIAWSGSDTIDSDITSGSTINSDFYAGIDTDSTEWLVSVNDGTWEQNPTLQLGEMSIKDINCSAGQYVTVQNHEMVCIDAPQPIIIKEVTMWTIGNIVIVAIIAAIVFKMMPKLTLFNFFKAVWRLVIRPFKRKEAIVKGTWKHAEYATRGKNDKEV